MDRGRMSAQLQWMPQSCSTWRVQFVLNRQNVREHAVTKIVGVFEQDDANELADKRCGHTATFSVSLQRVQRGDTGDVPSSA